MKDNLKKTIGSVVLLLITLIVLYFSLKDNFYSTIHYIKSMSIFWLLIAFFLFNIYLGCRALVTINLVHNFNKRYSFWTAFKMEYEIIFFNAITPFSTGGKPYEIYSLNKNGLKVTEASNVAIQNFIVYQLALVFLGLIALVYNRYFVIFKNILLLRQLVIAGFLLNTVVIIGLFLISFAQKSNRLIINLLVKIGSKLRLLKEEKMAKDRINEYLEEFHDGAINLSKNKLKFVIMILCHFISLSSFYAIPLIILYGLGDFTSLNITNSILTSAYVMLVASVVPMPGSTGGIEYAFLLFFGNFITGSKLNALMLIWRFLTFYLGIIIGTFLLGKRKHKIKIST